jgi:predicted DsbA family dithiol-disulfide isomerase
MDASSPLQHPTRLLTVISDTICPWCYIGKRRLDAALATLAEEGLGFEVEWRPFQLNPGIPEEGLAVRTIARPSSALSKARRWTGRWSRSARSMGSLFATI